MVTIQFLNEADPGVLFNLYPQRQEPQDAYIALSLDDDGTMWAGYNGEIGNAVPIDVWHGTVLRFEITPIQAEPTNWLMRELLPLAERVVAGGTVKWDGSNNVGVFSEDAQAAISTITFMARTGSSQEDDGFSWMTASEWFFHDPDFVPELIRAGKLSRQEIYARVEADLPTAPLMILTDLVEYVDELVEAHSAEENRKVALASIVQAHVQTRELYTRIAEATEGVRQLDGQIYDALHALLASAEEIAEALTKCASDIAEIEIEPDPAFI